MYMQSLISVARKLDEEGEAEKAFNAYLLAFEKGEGVFYDYINASFLAFIFQDFGFSNQKKIASEVIDEAYLEMTRILDKGDDLFGVSEESEFWRKYYCLILNGKSEYDAFCQEFLANLKDVGPPVNEKIRYLKSLRRGQQ